MSLFNSGGRVRSLLNAALVFTAALAGVTGDALAQTSANESVSTDAHSDVAIAACHSGDYC